MREFRKKLGTIRWHLLTIVIDKIRIVENFVLTLLAFKTANNLILKNMDLQIKHFISHNVLGI